VTPSLPTVAPVGTVVAASLPQVGQQPADPAPPAVGGPGWGVDGRPRPAAASSTVSTTADGATVVVVRVTVGG